MRYVRVATAATVIAMAAAFLVLGWAGVGDKSPTADEPMEAVAAFAAARDGELRVAPDTPPLSKYWAMLLEPDDALDITYGGPLWDNVVAGRGAWWWATGVLVAAGPERADAFLARGRVMMLLLGAGVCVVAARWAWEAAGPGPGERGRAVAAVVAGGLAAFDPNLLGHAPLVKSDVALVLCFVTAGWAAWRVGRDARARWVVLLALAAGAGPVVKFSGIILPAIACGMMFVRAMFPGPWQVRGHEVTGPRKWFVAAGICGAIAAGFLLTVWATYGFKSGPAVGPDEPWEPVGKVAVGMARAGLVPRTWAGGLARQRVAATEWPSYLMGQFSRTGWRDYFLWATAFKEPVATLAGGAAAVAVVWAMRRRIGRARTWDAACLALPAGAYAAAAMLSPVNAGLRHFLVVMPFAYVAIGITAAAACRAWGGRAKWVIGSLGALLVAEVVLACPNYIAFFNWPARAYGPLKLLADSNLDWGQDLKGLAAWQRRNPDVPLHVCYFGVMRPEFYGVRYTPLPGVPLVGRDEGAIPLGDGVAAVSATAMQGVYAHGKWAGAYRGLMDEPPREVIGGTIYLYDLDVLRSVIRKWRPTVQPRRPTSGPG